MKQDQVDRFKEAKRRVKKLVHSQAQKIGVGTSAISLENGHNMGCRDTHLLTIYAEVKSVSLVVTQQELEAFLDSGTGEQLNEQIAEAISRLNARL